MTHGEQWYIWKCKVNSFDYKFDFAERTSKTIRRMSREAAVGYYNSKCREVFASLGFKYKESDDFEERLKLAISRTRKSSDKMIKREARINHRLYDDFLKNQAS